MVFNFDKISCVVLPKKNTTTFKVKICCTHKLGANLQPIQLRVALLILWFRGANLQTSPKFMANLGDKL